MSITEKQTIKNNHLGDKYMKLSIEGTPEEIKNALQAICGSEERDEVTTLHIGSFDDLPDEAKRLLTPRM